MLVSVVIPTLNEDDYIEAALRSVEAQTTTNEVIVVDGGSSDSTAFVAENRSRIVHAARGRAAQMNAGARAATGEVLLFLHADTIIPANAMNEVVAATQAGYHAGTFRLVFDSPKSTVRRISGMMTRIRTPLFCFGDRALFVTRSAFEAVGGYPEIPIFEDLELARRLYDRYDFCFLDSAVTTSARRFRVNGDFRSQWLNARLWTRYMLGGDFNKLAAAYPYDA